MKKATSLIVIDKAHPRKDNTCTIYIRVTFQRKKREYSTGISLPLSDFERLIKSQRPKESERKVYTKILSFHSKALNIIERLSIFTFDQFESYYLNNIDAADSIRSWFERHINELNEQDRIGSAVSYNTALNCIESFKSGLKLADITPELLRKYEKYMIDAGKSISTVGIYMRSLRTIMNKADIDKKIYPFGTGKNKYRIPEGRNIKKALSKEEIKRIYNYRCEGSSNKKRAKDYWIFIYLSNGLNVKDFCLLKYENIDGDILKFKRAKSLRTKRTLEDIKISLKPETKEIIKRWGQEMSSPDTYIFPHLSKEMSAEKQRKTYQQLTKMINKYMRQIAFELGIDKVVTTYYARHSFATILKNSGTDIGFISEALGHSDTKTTKAYLAGFENDTIHSVTNELINFL